MVAGLFGPANWQVIKRDAKAAIAQRAPRPSTPVASKQSTEAAAKGAALHDWEPFFAHFGDATPQDAVSSTMLAFGRLMNDWHGYNQSGSRTPRATRAAVADDQARRLVKIVQALLGPKCTSKLHAVLCHAAEEIILRDDLTMADTSSNEEKHKEENAAYKLSNRQTMSAGRQVLTVAQSRVILQEELVALEATGLPRDAASLRPPGADASSDADVAASSSEDDGQEPVGQVSAQGGKRTAIATICEWQGLYESPTC